MLRAVLISVVASLLGSCSSEDVDPRCNAICAIDEPSIEGAGDICGQESASACKAECGARIEAAASLCASCLLEDACFDCGDGDGGVVFCGGEATATCEVFGREGTCTYPEGDTAAFRDCMREVNPRREVSCDYEFRSVTECADVCQ